MRLFRFALALCALFPVSAFVSAQPAMAQAPSCRWNLDGLWVGQRNGWRVNQKMRGEDFVVWAEGTPEPGQGVGEFLYRKTGPKEWTFTHSSGGKATARLDANGLLQTKQPAGPETFKRVRPAGAPRCLANTEVATSPGQADYNAALTAEAKNDYSTAYPLYRRACFAGLGDACANAGNIAYVGLLGGVNFEEAALMFRKGCDSGSSRSCFNLGAMFERGNGRPVDRVAALNFYRKALSSNPTPEARSAIEGAIARVGR